MVYTKIFEKILEYGALGIVLLGIAFILLPNKYPKASIMIVPIISILFILGNVPLWIIIGWTISGLVWFTIPIWVPMSKGEEPFTKPN